MITLFVIIGLLFTAALYAAAHYVWAVPERHRSEALAHRMGELRVQTHRSGPDLVRRQQRGSFAFVEDFFKWLGLFRRLQEFIDQANLRHRAANTAALVVLLALGGFAVAEIFRLPLLIVKVLAALFLGSLPVLYILFTRRRRLKQFENALPDSRRPVVQSDWANRGREGSTNRSSQAC